MIFKLQIKSILAIPTLLKMEHPAQKTKSCLLRSFHVFWLNQKRMKFQKKGLSQNQLKFKT